MIQKQTGQLSGIVLKVKNKTLTVLVSTKKKHAIYEKLVRYEKKYQVHNPENKEYAINSTVTIVPGKKVSKKKSFWLKSEL